MVRCKWIFKKKTDMDGKVHTYKARLLAKGYTQTHGIDYEETFSLVAKIKLIRIMLAIAAFHDYEIWQMDVKIAFLNGKLTEDVFMAQPYGFENEKYPKRLCKLQKAIYGLKQASRSWNLCFHKKVTQFGFSRSEDESWDATYIHGIKISSDLCPKTNDELDKISRVPYASAIGSIMYTMTCTRPDGSSFGKYVRSGCTTALDVVPWETDGESVLRESCSTRASTNTQTPLNVVNRPVRRLPTQWLIMLRPEKFNGQYFTDQWWQKMMFFLSLPTLGTCAVMKENAPRLNLLPRSSSNARAVQAVDA
ncbi:retrotransposon protein, putative, ty1-copia subclass [Tanacetum coccineum]